MMEYKSKISKANTQTRSKRTIVPSTIAELLGLDVGDELVWDADIAKNGVTVTVRSKKAGMAD